ncbi:hypothetical protein CPB84DRAFT_283275 [Gymnopilus junonius]|uniref:Uncharacterized protein n=1 Tax=Gymnopilus junonius TaxID=109634 RepID=A0A9P5TH38_GYMJU|nr:hypothetical protein CPB84DRAFT_283275 [Gymnopilus junonius]
MRRQIFVVALGIHAVLRRVHFSYFLALLSGSSSCFSRDPSAPLILNQKLIFASLKLIHHADECFLKSKVDSYNIFVLVLRLDRQLLHLCF